MRSLTALLLMAAAPAFAQVVIDKPWARATAPGAKVAAGYMVVRNKATVADRLMSVSSPAAARVETHVHIHEAGVMKMREVPGYDIPAGGAFELMPDLCDLCDLSATVPVLDCVATPPAYVSRLTPGSPAVFLNQSVVLAHWVQEGA